MAGLTPRFGLNFFGGGTDGSITDDNGKYTAADRLQIDSLFSALEKHNHVIVPGLGEPSDTPDAEYTAGTTGALEAGTTYYYVVSFVDASGLESVSGPETSVTLPDILPAPAAPLADTTPPDPDTGQLAAGLYYYALSGLRSTGEESPLGDVQTVTLLQGEDYVTLTLPDLGEADSYQIWRQKDTDPGWTRVGTSSTGSYADDGSVPAGAYGDPDNVPPTANTGVDNYSVTVTLGADDATAVQACHSWRLYRSETSGAYSGTSLVHEVIEHEDENDTTSPLLSEWIDDGDDPLTGAPKVYATVLDVPAYVFDQETPLPATSGYPYNYPMLDSAGVLYTNKAGTWTPIGVGGGTRGVGLFTGSTDPSTMPAGAQTGDVYINTTSGDIFIL